MTAAPSAPLSEEAAPSGGECEHLSSYQQGAIWNYCPDCGKRWERLSPPTPSPVSGEGEGKRPLDERLLRALSNNISGTLKPWVLQDALAHIDRWRNRAMIAEEAADQFRVELDAERAAHQATLESAQESVAASSNAASSSKRSPPENSAPPPPTQEDRQMMDEDTARRICRAIGENPEICLWKQPVDAWPEAVTVLQNGAGERFAKVPLWRIVQRAAQGDKAGG